MEVRELEKEIVSTSIWNNIVRLKIRWRDRIIAQEWSIKEVVYLIKKLEVNSKIK